MQMNRAARPMGIGIQARSADGGAGFAIDADLTTTEADIEDAINKWSLVPLGEKVHVLKLIRDRTPGGVIIPQMKSDMIGFDGVVIAVGPLAIVDHPDKETEGCQTRLNLDLYGRVAPSPDPMPGFRWSYRLQPGDRVRFAAWSGTQVEADPLTQRKAILMNSDDCTAVPRTVWNVYKEGK